MSKDHLLSIVSDNEGQVFVHADLEGVRLLIKELKHIEKALEANECPHTHLYSEAWAGWELTESKLKIQEDEKEQIHGTKNGKTNTDSNKFKNYHSLRSLGRAIRAPVLKALCQLSELWKILLLD